MDEDIDRSPDDGLRCAVERRLLDDADLSEHGTADRAALRRAVARALAAEGVVVAPARWALLVRQLVDDLGGLGPLEPLLRDPAVTDVMVNRHDDVWVERGGTLEPAAASFRDDAHVLAMLRRVLAAAGVRLDRAHPWADAVLDGGVRLHALVPPLTPTPVVTLRRVPAVVPSWDELIGSGAVTRGVADELRRAVAERRNIVVCGRAGVGKTTLLARLIASCDDRVVIIEDAPELGSPCRHAVGLVVRPPSPEGTGEVTTRDLLRNALRMRPDRLVVGEVRGSEVADLLAAMNTGHDGSMGTVHANGPTDALTRLEGMALLAGIPLAAARAQLASALDLVVALDRDPGGRRRVASVAKVVGTPTGPRIETDEHGAGA